MCGIVGYSSTLAYPISSQLLSAMNLKLKHRGPESSDIWIDDDGVVGLAHSRLAIQDLSSAGAQPMISHCARFIIVFNGEIYNHLLLRAKLDKINKTEWKSNSDTETLLSCFSIWGIEKTLNEIVGMFAIAIWDCQDGELILARDRIGEKPLYWGWSNGVFLFASELKSLKLHPAFSGEIDRDSLTQYFRYSYVPCPKSIFLGINKLSPGCYIRIPLKKHYEIAQNASEQAYWKLDDVIKKGQSDQFEGNDAEAIDFLKNSLNKSIKGQMLSDVPLGAFLSGGVDSSAVVALLQANSINKIKTFTIGFLENNFDESHHASSVAEYLNTDHTEFLISPSDAMKVIPNLPLIYCEPFADSSQIPTLLVSQLAKKSVTVALSGDGGDELFGGYNRYLATKNFWGKLNKLPNSLRSVISLGLQGINSSRLDQFYDFCEPILPNSFKVSQPSTKIKKLAQILILNDGALLYKHLTSQWLQPEDLVLMGRDTQNFYDHQDTWQKDLSLECFMMAMDTKTYLPDDILVKIDRAAMSCSLETRVPMLDHRVVETAWKMPLNYKIRNGESKWVLKQMLYRYVPKDLIERPKMGFGIPLAEWLRGLLRDWADELLDYDRIKREGYLNVDIIRKLWTEHLSCKQDWSYHIWSVLMFQAWLDQQ